MITFDVACPKFVVETLETTRRLVVSYGRQSADEQQRLLVCFQGQIIHTINQQQLKYAKAIDLGKISTAMQQTVDTQSTSVGYRQAKLSAKEKGNLVGMLMRSELLRYFGLLKKQTPDSVILCSSLAQKWNPLQYEFEESPVFGTNIDFILPLKQVWQGYTPPAHQKRKGAIQENTESGVKGQLWNTLDFWLFGPIIETKGKS